LPYQAVHVKELVWRITSSAYMCAVAHEQVCMLFSVSIHIISVRGGLTDCVTDRLLIDHDVVRVFAIHYNIRAFPDLVCVLEREQ